MTQLKCRPVMDNEKWINTKEAACFLGVTPNALRIMVHRKQVKYQKLGSRLRFKLADLKQLMEKSL